jgi:predicted transposase YdaD
MEFFFPEAWRDIDWSLPYEFLDKELHEVVREAEIKTRFVDKLVKVWRRSGEEVWVLVHIEVQSQVEEGFPKRMYVYNYRLFDRYERQVASLAVLGDPDPNWRPDGFSYDLWGCRPSLRFPTVKLRDLAADWPALEASQNPFAPVVMAHLKTQDTPRKPEERMTWKLRIVRGLYERGYTRQDVLELFRVIDWMMTLPPQLDRAFHHSLQQYEGEKAMPYVTSIERNAIEQGREEGREEGREQGLRQAIRSALLIRFERIPEGVGDALEAVRDVSTLIQLLEAAIQVESTEEFQQRIPTPLTEPTP